MKLFCCIIVWMFATTLYAQQPRSTYDFATIESIGYTIDQTLNEGNGSYFDSIFSFDLFSKRVLIKSQDTLTKKFNEGFTQGLKERFTFSHQIINEVNQGAFYNYLKFYMDEDFQFHLIFRLYSPEGLNYHDFLVENTPQGYRLADVYVYITGENMSDTFKSVYLSLIPSKSKDYTNFKEYILSIVKLKNAAELRREGKYKAAFRQFKKMPEKYRQQKIFKLNYVLATQHISEKKYLEALSEYKNSFPKDASLYLLLMDGYFLNGDYDQCLESLDSLDMMLDGDAFLDLYRANIYYQKGDIDKSEAYMQALLENFPTFYDGYNNMLLLYVDSKQYNKAVEFLDRLMAELEVPKEYIQKVVEETYGDFAKSGQFIDWKEKHEQ